MIIIFFIISVVIVFLDQISKFLVEKNLYKKSIPIIEDIFHFTYLENRGGAWGIFQDINWIFIILVPLFIAVICWYVFKMSKGKIEYIAGSFVVGGAIGNYIDRVIRGYVVDFLDFRVWPIFNVADIAIVIGCIFMIISFFTSKE